MINILPSHFTAVASVTTAVILPFIVPRVFTLIEQAKISEEVTSQLHASEERKEALLRAVHHRVKNNLAVIGSLFYLQSTHTKDEAIIQIFHDMENRVHSRPWSTRKHRSRHSCRNGCQQKQISRLPAT